MDSAPIKPAWARDMRYCRTLALRMIQEIRHDMDQPGGAEISPSKGKANARESQADLLVKMGSFLLKWHAFERGLDTQGLLDDYDTQQLTPEDEAIMEERLRRRS